MKNEVIGITPHELIKQLVREAGFHGGSIFLDDFCNLCVGSSRQECVAALKNNKNVLFIPGRKGHMSRALFGELRNNVEQAPSFRSPAATGPIRHHQPNRPTQRKASMVNETVELDPKKFRVRIRLQGQEIFFPLEELQLVPA
jgi:hypothetical protein